MTGATVELKVLEKRSGVWHTAQILETDRDWLAPRIDLSKVITDRHSQENPNLRSPWVACGDIRDQAIKMQSLQGGLAVVGLSHLILGVKPNTQRVRYLDSNPLNLVRQNLNPYGSTETRPRRSYSRPAKTKATDILGHTETARNIAHLDYSMTVETTEVYVVRVGSHIEKFFNKQQAVNRFAELMMDRVR